MQRKQQQSLGFVVDTSPGLPKSVIAYTNNVAAAIREENGQKLANLLSLEDQHVLKLYDDVAKLSYQKLENLEVLIRTRIDSAWADVLAAHLRVINQLAAAASGEEQGNGSGFDDNALSGIPEVDAAAEQINMAQYPFSTRLFLNLTRWSLPVLYVINRDLRELSIKADTALAARGQKVGKLEEAVRTTYKAFTYCITDSLILNYLIPIRLLRGVLPNQDYLNQMHEHYQTRQSTTPASSSLFSSSSPSSTISYESLFSCYGDFISACSTGNVRLFDEALVRNEKELVRRGTYLVVERCRAVCVRVLFKKVWIVSDRNPKLPMSVFQTSLRHAGADVPIEEVECMLAIMIDK
ncbi:COP9 signalosome (CSN) subunit, partial [Quaeritorhiza haematococci]